MSISFNASQVLAIVEATLDTGSEHSALVLRALYRFEREFSGYTDARPGFRRVRLSEVRKYHRLLTDLLPNKR